MTSYSSTRNKRNHFRIIAGEWRSRKLAFPGDVESLRPTTDRIRETLFNWLQQKIPGARCLDLFAGSGALGLEALSRGAGYCCFVEAHADSVRNIREHLATLECDHGRCVHDDAARFLKPGCPDKPFDIVFLDPPFGEHHLEPVCAALESGGWLAPSAWVYLESSIREAPPEVPANWRDHREKAAGEVRFQLFVREPQFV